MPCPCSIHVFCCQGLREDYPLGEIVDKAEPAVHLPLREELDRQGARIVH